MDHDEALIHHSKDDRISFSWRSQSAIAALEADAKGDGDVGCLRAVLGKDIEVGGAQAGAGCTVEVGSGFICGVDVAGFAIELQIAEA
jgi:hypothetical protein